MTAHQRFFYMMLLVIPLLVSLFAPQTAVASKMEQKYITKVLNLMAGDWYDTAGNRILWIQDGFINDCRVLAAYDFAGSSSNGAGRFEILESTGTRNLYLTWDIRGTDQDSIKLNDSQMLHHMTKPSFNESIAGIHLGMISADVAQVLGAPTETRNLSPYVNTYGWYYRSLGIAVTFDANTVDRILLMKGSSASLDRSGLNCENTPYEFAQAYHLKSIPKIDYDDRYSSGGCYAIGGGEYLSFGSRMNHIMLSKYWN